MKSLTVGFWSRQTESDNPVREKKNMYRMITKGEKYNMHKIGFQRYMVWVLLLLMLTGITACGKGRKQETGVLPSASTEEQMEETDTEEDTDDGKNAETEGEISGEIETDETLTDEDQTGWTVWELRNRMEEEEQLSGAVAYLGYREENDKSTISDWIQNNNPDLLAELPFLAEIPEDRILGAGYGNLFCVVPRDEKTSLAVNHVIWVPTPDGSQPQTDEVLYRSENAEPILLYAVFEEFREEPDVEINIIAGNGAQTHWYPQVSDYGSMILPAGYDEQVQLMDLNRLDELMSAGNDTADPPGDDWWLPPTNEGLADTTWVCEDWTLELHYGDCDPDFAGLARLYHRFEDNEEYTLLFRGVWCMEGDYLHMELCTDAGNTSGGSCPVLISPSGEELYVYQSETGYSPPFMPYDITSMTLTLSYG